MCAKRRMFSMDIIDTDAFLDMPLSAQALYFHLGMRGDDDGFVSNPKKIQKIISSSEDDYKLLIVKRFVIPFEKGICVIKHWRIHNLIRSDRHKETNYVEEKSLLTIKPNGSYTEAKNLPELPCQPNDNQMAHRLGKVSLGKDNIKNTKNVYEIDNQVYIYMQNESFESLFIDFLNLRNSLKAKNTERALKLLLDELHKHDINTAKTMIERSISNSWKGVFPLKETKSAKKSVFEINKEKIQNGDV